MQLKNNVVGYHIFINLLFNHRKFNFVEYRQFIWVFVLVGRPILFSFFQCNKKNICSNFFVHQYEIKDYRPNKMENKKKREQKIFFNSIKRNCKKDCINIIEIFLKMRKLKKRNISVTNRYFKRLLNIIKVLWSIQKGKK